MKQLICLILIGGITSLMACHKEVDEQPKSSLAQGSYYYSSFGTNQSTNDVFQKGYFYKDILWNLGSNQGTGEFSLYFTYGDSVLKCPSDTVVHWSYSMQNITEGAMHVIFKQWDMDQDTVVIYNQYLTGISSGILPLDSGTILMTNVQFINFTGDGIMHVNF